MKSQVFWIFSILSLCLFVSIAPVQGQTRFRGVMTGKGTLPAEVADLDSWNVNLIRFPLLNYTADTDSETEYFTWFNQELLVLDQFIEVARQNKIKVLIDLHTPPGGYVARDPKPQFRIFSESWAQQAMFRVWQELAERYKSNTTVWGYELANEPAQSFVTSGLQNWNTLARNLVSTIRVIDKSHEVVVNPLFGDPLRINSIKPIRGKKITYSVHMFYPQSFTHQGIYENNAVVSYPNKKLTKVTLLNHLKKLIDYQKKNKVQILVHEFSAVRWAPGKSAYNYIRDLISIFEANKWHWTYLAFRGGDDVWSVEHNGDRNDHNRTTIMTDREKLLRSYFRKNRKS